MLIRKDDVSNFIGGLLSQSELSKDFRTGLNQFMSKTLISSLIYVSILLLILSACGDIRAVRPSEGTSPPDSIVSPTISLPTSTSSPIPEASPVQQDSEEGITFEENQGLPSIPPHQVEIALSETGITISWSGTGSDIDLYYTVYRRLLGELEWEQIGTMPVEDNNRGNYQFEYSVKAEEADLYEYAVSTTDQYGKESQLSEIVSIPSNP